METENRKPKYERTRGTQRRREVLTDYVQDYIPIKNIKNGIVETTDGRYIKILEIEPINFMLRSATEQAQIINNFAAWFKVSNMRIQFKSITKKADTERHIELLKKDMADETNERTKDLSRSYIRLIREVGNQEALTRRFFIILEYEPQSRTEKFSMNTVYNQLANTEITLRSFLKRCGNNVVDPDNPDVFIGEVLYMFFNRRSSIETPFQYRAKRVYSDIQKAKGVVLGSNAAPVEVPVINYIAPRGLDLTHVNYMIMDGLYYTYLYIKDNGYPSVVTGGWISSLVNAGEGIDVDVFFEKQDKNAVLDRLARQIRWHTSKIKDLNGTNSNYEVVRDAIQSAYFIKEAVTTANQDIFFMNTIISINAPTLEMLKFRKRHLLNMLKSMDILVGDFRFEQDVAFNNVMPLLRINKNTKKKSRRNVVTISAASTYMFTSFEMCDDNGILLGINEHNNSLCIIDLFNSKVYKNANMCIIGTSGAGKTFTEQLMALRMRMRGIQVFIIAPLKGHEFRRACEQIGGTYIKIAPSSPHCINIMEIREYDQSTDIEIEGEGAIEEDSYLAKKVEQLHVFFRLLMPDMTIVDEQLLDDALMTTYALYGIFTNNDSIYDNMVTKTLKKMPTLSDVYKQLSTNSKTTKLAAVLSRFVTGSARNFDQQTNINLDNKYIVMDISELKGTLLPVGMFIALDYVWDKAKEDRTKKKAIFIDETWKLVGSSSNKYAAEFVLEIFKIIRGYGGAAIAATQDLGDFFALEDGKYGRGIINNSKTKIVLNLEPDEADFVRDSMKLSESEYNAILNFERGHALLSTNSNKVTVFVRASETETDLITTDRAQLQALAEKNKKKQ